jgi:hypothetical protein
VINRFFKLGGLRVSVLSRNHRKAVEKKQKQNCKKHPKKYPLKSGVGKHTPKYCAEE